MTLEISEMPIVSEIKHDQYGNEHRETNLEEVVNVSKNVESADVDEQKLTDANEVKKMREKFGYDDKVSDSVDKILSPSRAKLDAETLVRFRTIVNQAQFTLNLFSDPDLLKSLNAWLRPGTTFGEPGSLWYQELYDTGEYKLYLQTLASILERINNATKAKGTKLSLGEVQQFVKELQGIDTPDVEEVKDYYRDQKVTSGKDEKLFVLQKLGERARDFMLKNGYEDKTEAYNLEEVVGIMMLSSDNKFRTGHERELMNTKGEVQLHNLLAWFYDQLTYFSDFQDDDPLQAYQSISFYTSFRQISAAELIIYNPKRYFAHRVDTGLKKDNQRPTSREDVGWQPIYETDNNYRPYQRLRDYLVTVVTNSGLAHDFGIQYEKTKEDREKFHENMRGIFGEERSEFGNRMLRWLNLLGTSREEVYRYLEGSDTDHEAGGTVGQATRQTLLAYYYFDQLGFGDLRDKDNMFIKALGQGNEAFFDSLIMQAVSENDVIRLMRQKVEKKIFEARQKYGKEFDIGKLEAGDSQVKLYRAYLNMLGKLKNADTDMARDDIVSFLRQKDNLDIVISLHQNLGYETASIENAIKNGDRQDVALALANILRGYKKEDLNFFHKPTQVIVRKEQKEFVMAALRDAIRTHFIKIQPEVGMSKEDADYVKEFAMLMPGWLGIASKNDASTNSLTFWTTMLNFFDYRKDHMSQVYTGETESLNGIMKFLTPLEALCVQVKETTTDKAGVKHITPRKMSMLEWLQGGQGLAIDVEKNRYSRGEFTVNTGKKYWQEHMRGMIDLREFFYNNRGLDLGDILKHQHGTGEVTIDPEKLKKFKSFWSAARNAFAKNGDVRWDTKVVVRSKKLSKEEIEKLPHSQRAQAEKNGGYIFEEKTLAEMVFHKNIIGAFDGKHWVGGMDVNHGHTPHGWQADIDSGKDRSKQGELFVRDMIGWGIMISFMLHKYNLNPFTESFPNLRERLTGKHTRSHMDPLWEKWEMGEFRHVHEFFKHMPINAEEMAMEYGKRKWWLFGKRENELQVYKMHESFFDEKDLYDIEKKSFARFSDFLKVELALGTSGSFLTFLWQILTGTLKQGIKLK